MTNQPQISISGTQYTLQFPIQFIAGDIVKMQFESNFPKINLPWLEVFDKLSENKSPMIDIIFKLYQILQFQNDNAVLPWIDYWTEVTDYYQKIEKFTGVYINLHKIVEIKDNYLKLKDDLLKLNKLNDSWKNVHEQQHYTNQINILNQLKSQFQEFLGHYEIEKDEFDVYQNRMQQYLNAKTTLDHDLSSIKVKQRSLYRQTNQVTKEMDDLEPRMQTYESKLEKYITQPKDENFHRLDKKNKVIQEQYNILQQDKNYLMNQSKDLKKNTVLLKRKFRESTQKSRKYESEFQKAKEDFSKLESNYLSMQTRIQELESSVKKIINNENTQDNHGSSEILSTTFTSRQQLERIISEKETELKSYEIQLIQICNSAKIIDIEEFLNLKSKNLQKSLNNFETQCASANISQFGEGIAFFIQFMSNFQEIYSIFLESIKASFSFSFQVDPSNISFNIQANYVMKNQQLADLENFNRWEKSYVFLSLILSSYMAMEKKIIPVQWETLPRSLTTEKTFLKVIEMLRSVFHSTPRFENHQIIFFLNPDAKEILPIIKIDEYNGS